MNISDALADLAAETGHATRGVDLFIDRPMPPSPNRAVAMQIYGGSSPDRVHDRQGHAYENPRCQVLVRSEPLMPKDAQDTAIALYRHLGAIQNRTVDGVRIVSILTIDFPSKLRDDEEDRTLYVFNVEVKLGVPELAEP